MPLKSLPWVSAPWLPRGTSLLCRVLRPPLPCAPAAMVFCLTSSSQLTSALNPLRLLASLNFPSLKLNSVKYFCDTENEHEGGAIQSKHMHEAGGVSEQSRNCAFIGPEKTQSFILSPFLVFVLLVKLL